MNIKDILESKEAIEALIGTDVPINAAIKISKVQKELNNILEIYENKRKALFDKYGEKDGENIKVKDENVQIFSKEHLDLVKEELDIIVEPITISDLGDINIKPAHLTHLDWLLI